MQLHKKWIIPFRHFSVVFMLAILVFSVGTGTPITAIAQNADSNQAAAAGTNLSSAQLEELIGPIALYPDELIAIVLPASTFPLEIVQASRFLEKRKQNPKLEPDKGWDASVLGLLNYPEVIEVMNNDLNWIWKLGEAVVNQQQDVMTAVQQFRAKVHTAGNLNTSEQQVIVVEKEIIKIVSASPEVIYVPSYNPSTVVVYSTAPYPYAYSAPYPYYYNPAAAFWTGMFVGAAISYGVARSWPQRHQYQSQHEYFRW